VIADAAIISTVSSRRLRRVIAAATVAVAAAAIPAVRHGALRFAGGALLLSDPVEPSDVVVLSETGGAAEFQAAELEAADLYARGTARQVMLLRPAPDAIDGEQVRRGVRLEDPAVTTLRQLGVPDTALIVADAGEGGTTDSTHAVATWVRAHPSRVVVVIGAAHSRRYRRALMRVWPSEVPAPRVTYPQRTAFRADDWWRSRRTLREGLFELQKLAWDYIRHPW
jgi:hypothetical protein